MKRLPVMLAVIFGLGMTLALIHASRSAHGPKLKVGLVGLTNVLGTSYAVFTLSAEGSVWVDVADPMVELRRAVRQK